tara:strand:- start:24 stop:1025 length:1002 start_codon:yes stop_codon:yes gene_type:complete
MSQNITKTSPKSRKSRKKSQNFYCEYCDYYSCRKNDYVKHLGTQKHKKKASPNVTKTSPKSLKTRTKVAKIFVCECCNKEYKSRNGLWRHKKKCIPVNLKIDPEVKELKEIIENQDEKIQLLIENQKHQTKFVKMVAPVIKAIGENGGISSQNNCNNTTNNTINNNININLYLNEHCKNALNIEDFVKKIQLSLEDYNFALENGYAKGVTNVLIKNIEDLDDTERPIHSSDKKRGKFYVKSQGEWKKENGEMVDQVITTVGNKLNTYDVDNISVEDFKDPEVMELYQKNTLKLAKKSDPKEANKERKKIKSELANTVSLKDALEKANEKITNE